MKFPSEPEKGLLKRGLPVAVDEAVNKMAGVIDRVVAYGTHLFLYLGPKTAAKDGSLTPPLMLMYHVIEVADSIAVLVRRGCIDTAGSLLRSEIEAAFSLFYMLEEKTEQRGRAYRYAVLYDEAVALERMDSATPRGREATNRLMKDRTLKAHKVKFDSKALRERVKKLREAMDQPRLVDVAAEWKRIEGARKKPVAPHWYQLFNGPNDLAQLSERVGLAGWYDLFYRTFSGEVHAGNAMDSFSVDKASSRALFRPLRHPGSAANAFSLCVSVLLEVYSSMITKFDSAQEQDFAEWYLNQIQADFMAMQEWELGRAGKGDPA